MKTLSDKLESVVLSLADAIPPYHIVQGPLDAKETGQAGAYYIHVAGAKVQVDEATFEALSVGEMLKVRYTRRNRAINIDRYVPPNGQE